MAAEDPAGPPPMISTSAGAGAAVLSVGTFIAGAGIYHGRQRKADRNRSLMIGSSRFFLYLSPLPTAALTLLASCLAAVPTCWAPFLMATPAAFVSRFTASPVAFAPRAIA